LKTRYCLKASRIACLANNAILYKSLELAGYPNPIYPEVINSSYNMLGLNSQLVGKRSLDQTQQECNHKEDQDKRQRLDNTACSWDIADKDHHTPSDKPSDDVSIHLKQVERGKPKIPEVVQNPDELYGSEICFGAVNKISSQKLALRMLIYIRSVIYPLDSAHRRAWHH
jgi:hypothetical protein